MNLPRVIGMLLLSLIAAGSAQAQFAVPTSDYLISIDIITPPDTLPSSVAVQVSVREGAMVSVRSEDNFWYGFVFSRNYPEEGNISLSAFRLEPRDGSVGAAFEIQSPKPLNHGLNSIPTPHGNFSVTVLGVEEKDFSTPIVAPGTSSYEELRRLYGGGTCCVFCSPLTVCATTVSKGACGTCASKDH